MECQLSGPVDISKYEKLHQSKHGFKEFPRVIVISQRKVSVKSEVDFRWTGLELKEFEDIFKDPA